MRKNFQECFHHYHSRSAAVDINDYIINFQALFGLFFDNYLYKSDQCTDESNLHKMNVDMDNTQNKGWNKTCISYCMTV